MTVRERRNGSRGLSGDFLPQKSSRSRDIAISASSSWLVASCSTPAGGSGRWPTAPPRRGGTNSPTGCATRAFWHPRRPRGGDAARAAFVALARVQAERRRMLGARDRGRGAGRRGWNDIKPNCRQGRCRWKPIMGSGCRHFGRIAMTPCYLRTYAYLLHAAPAARARRRRRRLRGAARRRADRNGQGAWEAEEAAGGGEGGGGGRTNSIERLD